ncbi:MAG: glycerol kinase, partial [Limisphaerales bacterium]
TADLIGLPLRVSRVTDSSARGAAMCGMLGLGVCNSFEDLARLPHEGRTFQPQMDPVQAKRLYDGWLAAVQRIL